MFQVLLCVFLFNPHRDPETDLVLSYFTCKEAKTQRVMNLEVAEPGLNHGLI